MPVGVDMRSVVIPLNRMHVVLEGEYPPCDFYRDLAFAHVVDKSFMVYIVEGAGHIHEDNCEYFSLLPRSVYILR